MLWLYQLAMQRMTAEFKKSREYHAISNADKIEGEVHRVKSRIQAPRPRPKGYWNPFCPGA